MFGESGGGAEFDDFGNGHVFFMHPKLGDGFPGLVGAAVARARLKGDHDAAGLEGAVCAGDGGGFVLGVVQRFEKDDGVETALAVEGFVVGELKVEMSETEGIALLKARVDGIGRDVDADGFVAPSGQHDRKPAYAAAKLGYPAGWIAEEVEDGGDVAEVEITLVVGERLAEGVIDSGISDPGVIFAFALLGVGRFGAGRHEGYET